MTNNINDYQKEEDVNDDRYNNRSPLKQLKLYFNCDDIDGEEISEFLFEIGVLSVSVEVQSEKKGVLNDEKKWADLVKTKSWATAMLRANFPDTFQSDTLKEIINTAYPNTNFEMEVVDIEDTDWVTQVQTSWKPQIIDDLTIRFPWHDPEETQTSMELVLEGGAAFGTGDHPTTRLCCRWLARNIEKNEGISVLDYGCGSAILGLAALRYGASKADGTDIDLDALISASRNCINNNLIMDLYLADDSEIDEVQSIVMNRLRGSNSNINFLPVTEIEDNKYDLVVANILAPILISLAPQLAKHTKPGGRIALSGLVIQQKDVLISRYSEFFEDVIMEESEDDWILITGKLKDTVEPSPSK